MKRLGAEPYENTHHLQGVSRRSGHPDRRSEVAKPRLVASALKEQCSKLARSGLLIGKALRELLITGAAKKI